MIKATLVPTLERKKIFPRRRSAKKHARSATRTGLHLKIATSGFLDAASGHTKRKSPCACSNHKACLWGAKRTRMPFLDFENLEIARMIGIGYSVALAPQGPPSLWLLWPSLHFSWHCCCISNTVTEKWLGGFPQILIFMRKQYNYQ